MKEFDLPAAFAAVHERFNRIDERFNRAEDNVQVIRDMATETATQLKTLLGNGQPGEISHIKGRITVLEEYKNRAAGYVAGISFVVTAAAHVVLGWLRSSKQ